MWNQLLGLLGGTKLLGFTGFFFYTVNPFSLPFRRFGDDRQSYRVLLGFLFFIHFIDLGRYILLGFYWVFFVFFFKDFQPFFIAFVETSTKLPGCTGFFFWFGLETVSIGFIGRFGTIDIVTEFYCFFLILISSIRDHRWTYRVLLGFLCCFHFFVQQFSLVSAAMSSIWDTFCPIFTIPLPSWPDDCDHEPSPIDFQRFE